jgi:hypothetical protein
LDQGLDTFLDQSQNAAGIQSLLHFPYDQLHPNSKEMEPKHIKRTFILAKDIENKLRDNNRTSKY